MFSYYAKVLDIDREKLVQSFSKIEHNFQTGKLTEKKVWESICKYHGKPIPSLKNSIWGEGLKQQYQPKQKMFSLVKHLKKQQFKTALLSNTEPPMVPIFHEHHPDHLLHFDTLIFSCIEGHRKPHAPIYHLALQQLQTIPEETLFVDDKEKNVIGAKKAGLHGHVFHTYQTLKKELASFGIEV